MQNKSGLWLFVLWCMHVRAMSQSSLEFHLVIQIPFGNTSNNKFRPQLHNESLPVIFLVRIKSFPASVWGFTGFILVSAVLSQLREYGSETFGFVRFEPIHIWYLSQFQDNSLSFGWNFMRPWTNQKQREIEWIFNVPN